MIMSVGTDLYPHMPILRPHAVFYERRISSVTFTSALYLYGNVYMRVDGGPRAGRFVRFWASGEQSSQKWEIPHL